MHTLCIIIKEAHATFIGRTLTCRRSFLWTASTMATNSVPKRSWSNVNIMAVSFEINFDKLTSLMAETSDIAS